MTVKWAENDSRAMAANCARAYVRANPGTPHRTIARIMAHDRPDLWATIESARRCVRSVTGHNGTENRAHQRVDTFDDAAMVMRQEELAAVPPGIPDGIDPSRLAQSLGTGELWAAIGDLHIPEHNRAAVETAIAHTRKAGCKNLIIMGDAVEHSQTSRFLHNPKAPDIWTEIKMLAAFLKYVRSVFTGRIVYKAGNHEDNLRRFIWEQAPALAGVPGLEFGRLVEMDKLGVEYVEQRVALTVGHLTLIHGHEYKGGSVYPAQWLLRKARRCSACWHFHTSDSARGKDVLDTVVSTWSVGCLRDLNPLWMSRNNWNWGFAVIESESDGNFEFRNMNILAPGEVVPA